MLMMDRAIPQPNRRYGRDTGWSRFGPLGSGVGANSRAEPGPSDVCLAIRLRRTVASGDTPSYDRPSSTFLHTKSGHDACAPRIA